MTDFKQQCEPHVKFFVTMVVGVVVGGAALFGLVCVASFLLVGFVFFLQVVPIGKLLLYALGVVAVVFLLLMGWAFGTDIVFKDYWNTYLRRGSNR